MILNPGTQERYIIETTVGSGVTVREGSTLTDAILVGLWVDSVSSGDLNVVLTTLTQDGEEDAVITFPAVSAGTTNLLLRKSATILQRFKIIATYTGICQYKVYVRAISGSGESSTRIIGSASLTTDQVSINTTPSVLIASSLEDRTGLVIKNWSVGGNLFVSEDISKLPARGYPLAPKDALALDIAAGVTIYAVSDSGTLDIRFGQAGG